jgi:NADPH-dependent 2,4-dienoyl-CoA reductase/sulfur reductase-like enzyme
VNHGGTGVAEYIEREKLTKALKIWQNILIEEYGENDEYVRCLESVFIGIENAPAADVRPVARGKWIQKKNWTRGVCSACSWEITFVTGNSYNFCPNCGADMREES